MGRAADEIDLAVAQRRVGASTGKISSTATSRPSSQKTELGRGDRRKIRVRDHVGDGKLHGRGLSTYRVSSGRRARRTRLSDLPVRSTRPWAPRARLPFAPRASTGDANRALPALPAEEHQHAAGDRENSASRSAKPMSWSPRGSPASLRSGSEIVGTPSIDPGATKTGSPVEPSPTGAAPVAVSVMQASNSTASACRRRGAGRAP